MCLGLQVLDLACSVNGECDLLRFDDCRMRRSCSEPPWCLISKKLQVYVFVESPVFDFHCSFGFHLVAHAYGNVPFVCLL